MNFTKALEVAGKFDDELAAIDHSLSCADPRFQRSVSLVHHDGSYLLFKRAFLLKREDWLFVFTEHHSYHVYNMGDLIAYYQFDNSILPVEELP